jgi:hypothetical protein
MTSDQLTDRPTHCRACGAAVRQDVPWCLQCYASLAQEPAARPSPARPAQQTRSDDEPVAASPRRVGRHAALPAEPEARTDDVEVIAAQMLAQLAAADSGTPTWTSRLPSSSTGKVALIAGLGAAGAVLVLGVLAIVGALL